MCAPMAWAAQRATTTTLAVAAGGASVTTIPAQTVVTLTATVGAGDAAVTTGQVKFCDATATYCTDIHVLGTAQVTSAGVATFKFTPGVGSRSYKAVFVGTNTFAASMSSISSLVVTGSYATLTGITSTGGTGTYSLTASVTGVDLNAPAPSGSVSFVDTSNSNAVLGNASLVSGSSALTFLKSANPAVGFNPQSILVADFNGDGISDVGTLNYQSQTITVSLGNNDGTFTAAASIPIGKFANAFTVADFNGDGIPDLAVVFNNNYLGSTGSFVTVLLGNGDGTFTATPTSPSVGNNPAGIVAGDFNGDGIQDLAVANQIDGTITILLGNGDGTLKATSASPVTGSAPGSIVAADFNADGKLDLAVANLGSDTLSIFLGNGDGTFIPAASPTVGVYPDSVVAADLNGDGIQDLVVGNEQSNVTVLLGVGNGTFQAASSPGFAMVVAIGDFNGDGIPDLAGTQGYVTRVFLGDGGGTFSTGPTYIPSPLNGELEFTCITVGDFNGDGLSDLAMAGVVVYGAGLNGQSQILLSSPRSTAAASASMTVGPGSHLMEASYSGDANYNPSVSATATLTGKPVPTVLNLNVPAGPYTVGQSLILTATLSPYTDAGYSTNGETVSFNNGATFLGTGKLSEGVATMNFVVPTAGQYSFSAVYGGDVIFVGSSSSTIAVTASFPRFVVATNADNLGTASNCASVSSNPCSLRDALAAAQSHGGTITFDPTVFSAANSVAQNTITLGGAGTLAVPASTTITGATSGSDATLTNLVTISGNNAYGIFSVASGVNGATISNLTITQGKGNSGGAINNAGSLAVNHCTLSNNTASQGYGGAIQNTGQLSVNGSTFANNNAVAAGGAIYATSALAVNNSTFSGNTGGQGGAIYIGASLTMTNSTLYGNSGGAIFNNGLAMGSNNILGGDAGGECYGPGCLTGTNTYFLVSGAEQQIGGVWDSGPITLGWSGGSYTLNYGQYSTPAGISSGFGGGISSSGWPGGAQGFGPYFVLGSSHGAPLAPITITNSSKSFALTQVSQSLLFSSNGNIVATAAKLSPLGNYGGPTQTMIPLPGSPAICAGLASALTPSVNTDQRGLANTTTSYPGYSSTTPCVDAGSVQTHYAMSFSSQPPATVTAVTPFAVAVTLSESGSGFSASSVAIPLTLTGNGSLLNASASTSSTGIATYPSLSVSLPGAGDNLNANLSLNLNVSITAPSNSFTVTAGATTTVAASQTAIFSPGNQGIALTAQVTSSLGTVSAGSVTFTILQGSIQLGSTTNSPVSSGRATVFAGLPGGTPAGTYTIQAVYNAGGAFATSSDSTHTVTVQQATPPMAWTTP
ncbi:MAG: FG-GAP-like repeat-containing protein, partial [Acidobacteriota bacterium]|nr:FG-GAP-like repeat-containing protein [Acidobacteriota bacterium]